MSGRPSRTRFVPLPAAFAALLPGALAIACSNPPDAAPPPPPENHSPVARAGGPYQVDGRTVVFDGSGSRDPDGDMMRFTWLFGDGATAEGVTLPHDYADYGTDTVRLTVTDSHGAQATDMAVVTRRAPAVRFSGAGNISECGKTWDDRTADILDSLGGVVFTAGDNAFPHGTAADYACYDAGWGRLRDRTVAVLGNHEYDTGTADAAFDYFGARAGPRGKGYYSTTVGAWHVIVLNDNDTYVPFGAGSAQLAWLQADLAADTARCTVALWHRPRFLSSRDSGYTQVATLKPLWDALYAAGVDVIVNGHQHHYERMAPMDADGVRDDARGIRQFNVGTGGASLIEPTVIHPLSEARAVVFGVLSLALRPDRYEWRFIAAPGQPPAADSGAGTCH